MSDISVAAAQVDDVDEIVQLLDEMDVFYGHEPSESPQERATGIRSAIFDPSPFAYLLVARGPDGPALGLAAYSFLWPATGSTRSLFLKELYVRQDRRTGGVGRALMRRIFDIGSETGCSRVEWMTETTNVDAQRFYEKIGGPRHPGKIFYRLNLARHLD